MLAIYLIIAAIIGLYIVGIGLCFAAKYGDKEPGCHEHEWETRYPIRECLICGLMADAPEPTYEEGI